MKFLILLTIIGLLAITNKSFSQDLPYAYQAMFNEIVTNFETITGSNSISQGKNTLSVVNENKIALRVQHKGSVKNLTFETTPDEENNLYWIAANPLTIDMVNKYEDYLTKTLESMFKLSEKKSNE